MKLQSLTPLPYRKKLQSSKYLYSQHHLIEKPKAKSSKSKHRARSQAGLT